MQTNIHGDLDSEPKGRCDSRWSGPKWHCSWKIHALRAKVSRTYKWPKKECTPGRQNRSRNYGGWPNWRI